jgi:non-ribosomal peptide synthetase component F
VSIYVLDHRQCLLPPGITGEVYISGEQVTGKYLNAAAEQTKTVFVPDHISWQKTRRLM